MSKTTRHYLAAAFLVAAAAASLVQKHDATPTPAPIPPGTFTLRGKFIGPNAAADAALFSSLCDEIADRIEWDGMQAEPRLKTGAAFDDLRIAAREARMKGESIGDRQSKAREAVRQFLIDALGESGGPVGPKDRAAWVTAFRDIGRAAADAAR